MRKKLITLTQQCTQIDHHGIQPNKSKTDGNDAFRQLVREKHGDRVQEGWAGEVERHSKWAWIIRVSLNPFQGRCTRTIPQVARDVIVKTITRTATHNYSFWYVITYIYRFIILTVLL